MIVVGFFVFLLGGGEGRGSISRRGRERERARGRGRGALGGGSALSQRQTHLQRRVAARVERALELEHVAVLLRVDVLVWEVDGQAVQLEPHRGEGDPPFFLGVRERERGSSGGGGGRRWSAARERARASVFSRARACARGHAQGAPRGARSLSSSTPRVPRKRRRRREGAAVRWRKERVLWSRVWFRAGCARWGLFGRGYRRASCFSFVGMLRVCSSLS